MNKELKIVEQPELTGVVQKSKVELTKAQAHAMAFAPLMKDYHELASVLTDLDKVNPTPEHAKKAREARLKMVKIRTGSDAVKDDRKAILLIESNLIQDLYNVVKNTCALTESEFMAIEKHQERIESERLEAIRQERVLLLEPYGEVNQFVDLKAMDQPTFEKYLANEKLAFETRLVQEKQAELDRIEAEKKAELERLEKERLEAERIEAQRLENIRLKEESDKLQVEQKKLAEEQAKKDAIAKAESERLAKIAAEEKAKADKLQAELKAKQDAEKLAQEQEKARIEAEEADKLAKEKAALLAPDKEKVKAFFVKFDALRNEFPELTSELGIELSVKVKESLALVRGIIINESKKLV